MLNSRRSGGLRLQRREMVRPQRVSYAGEAAAADGGGTGPRLPVRLWVVHRARTAYVFGRAGNHIVVQFGMSDVLRFERTGRRASFVRRLLPGNRSSGRGRGTSGGAAAFRRGADHSPR